MKDLIQKSTRRKWKASLRDTFLLLREFRAPLAFFVLLVVGGGALFHVLSQNSSTPTRSLIESAYQILTMTFLQSSGDFPTRWDLQLFYFVMPIAGLALLARGLTDFGVTLFNRRGRVKEWEMAVASTLNHHTVLIGLGHLGYRVVHKLHEMEQDVAVITIESDRDLMESVRALGIPVIEDDGRREVVLASAGVPHARAVVLCTQNDSLNLQIALKARSMNPDIQVIVRIFDDDFAHALQEQFGFQALSATGMAAPVFAASAANVDITPPITIDRQANSLARFIVQPDSPLIGQTVEEVENHYQVSIVLIVQNGARVYHPQGGLRLTAGCDLALLGSPNQINLLVHANHH